MDQDPFGLSNRKILGPYKLNQIEGGLYYLLKAGEPNNGGGIIEGTVQEISWGKDMIYAKRLANYGGDQSGWMIIDVTKEKITGPISEDAFRKQFPGVVTWDPATAWGKL